MVGSGEFAAAPDSRTDVELASRAEFYQSGKVGLRSFDIADLTVSEVLQVDQTAEHRGFRAEAVQRFCPKLWFNSCAGRKSVGRLERVSSGAEDVCGSREE